MMGLAKFAVWKAGKIDWPDFAARFTDDVYGEMLVEASLKGILGEQAKQYYQQAA